MGGGDAYPAILKRNKCFATNAFLVSNECSDLLARRTSDLYQQQPELFVKRPRCRLLCSRCHMKCITVISSDRAAQDDYSKATNLEDLTSIRDNIIERDAKYYENKPRYFRFYVRHQSARGPYKFIDSWRCMPLPVFQTISAGAQQW